MVVPSMATRKRHSNNSFPPLVVGFTGLTALVGWPAVFVFFGAEFLAAVVAGFAFRALNAGDGSKSRELPLPAPGPPASRNDPHPVGWDFRENGSTRAW